MDKRWEEPVMDERWEEPYRQRESMCGHCMHATLSIDDFFRR